MSASCKSSGAAQPTQRTRSSTPWFTVGERSRSAKRLAVLCAKNGLALLPQTSRYQIDHRSRHTATQPDRTGKFLASAERGWRGEAARLDLDWVIPTASP